MSGPPPSGNLPVFVPPDDTSGPPLSGNLPAFASTDMMGASSSSSVSRGAMEYVPNQARLAPVAPGAPRMAPRTLPAMQDMERALGHHAYLPHGLTDENDDVDFGHIPVESRSRLYGDSSSISAYDDYKNQ